MRIYRCVVDMVNQLYDLCKYNRRKCLCYEYCYSKAALGYLIVLYWCLHFHKYNIIRIKGTIEIAPLFRITVILHSEQNSRSLSIELVSPGCVANFR